MARKNDIDWDSISLNPGGFWHSPGDGTNVVIGFGTPRGNKFVQRRQEGILDVLAAMPALIAGTGGTDDADLQLILDAITEKFPKVITFEEVLNDPDGLGKRYFELAGKGLDRETVLKQLTADRAEAQSAVGDKPVPRRKAS
jgi:hypothetical protein